MPKKNYKLLYTVFTLLGAFAVVLFALKIAPYIDNGIIYVAINYKKVFLPLFSLNSCSRSLPCALIMLLIYAFILLILYFGRLNYRKREEHGSAKWGDVNKICSKYKSKNSENDKILTQNFMMSCNDMYHMRNLNTLVIGGSGAGKSRNYARPNILNSEKNSIVVLDPKAELLKDTGCFLRDMGYKIRVLDLINYEKSNLYNPFYYIRDDNDIQKLVTNLFMNTNPKGIQTTDPFWDNAAMMLLMALVSYLFYFAPKDEQNFSMVLDLIRSGDISEDNDRKLSPLDALFNELEKNHPDHIALKYYRNYRSGSAKTLKSIQITLVSRLEKFNLPSISSLTRDDNMHLELVGEEKTAIFAVIPDNDTSFNFIVGMLYTQLFQCLYYSADYIHNGRLPCPVHFIMDEFANGATRFWLKRSDRMYEMTFEN